MLNAWYHNLWRCSLNHFAIPAQAGWHFVSPENIASGTLLNNFHQGVSQVWVAPVVWQRKCNQTYWIPIWIPAVLQEDHLRLSEHQLPWMAPSQFSPDTQSPFAMPLHCFDEWLQFEWLDEEGKLTHQHWAQAYQAIQGWLRRLSNHADQQLIHAWEFTPDNAIVMLRKEGSPLSDNKLIQNFATIWEYEPHLQWDHEKCTQKAKHWGLSSGLSVEALEAAVHVLALQEGELLAVNAPVGANTAQFMEAIVPILAKTSPIYLFNQHCLAKYDPMTLHWQQTKEVEKGAFVMIENAQRFLPQEVLPVLAHATKALFLGDNQDMTALPLMSAMPESWDLACHGITDDDLLDQLHYKGMLPSTGNAMSVALANSAYQHLRDHGLFSNTFSLLKDTSVPPCQGILVAGESKAQGNGFINEKEAQFIITWLMSGPLNQAWESTAIVTPFVQQRDLIAHYFKAHEVPCQVFTFHELPATQWPQVIFSPVYSSQHQRPFIFDQGEHLLYSLMRRAQQVWVIGSLTIFNPRMHSPSGKLGMRLSREKNGITT